MTTTPALTATRRGLLAIGLGSLALLACSEDDGFQPGVPAGVSLGDTAFVFTAIGQNHRFTAVAIDGHGHTIDVPLTWSTSDPSVVRVNGDGLATAAGLGAARVTVSAGAAIDSAGVTIQQAPAHLLIFQGDGQGGQPGQALLGPLVVQVTDALNHPVGGVAVSFVTTDSGASVLPDTAFTEEFGTAATTLTLGPATGGYTVTASVVGTALTDTFHLHTSGPFSIELMFVSNSPTAAQAQAFAAAQQRWEAIITGDLPDDYATLPGNSCGASPPIDRPIDDLLIFVSLENIDGPGGILGQAGPCFLHNVGLLPAIGQMTFDAADLDVIDSLGLLAAVVTHEMGHVLGYGTLWSDQGLLADPSQLGGLDPHFTGLQAVASFDSLGGSAYIAGKVPVEDQGGAGTADGHWRETVFVNELMTGYVDLGANPLSAVSIASMADLGYAVDFAPADPYVIAAPFRNSGSRGRLHLLNDIARVPLRAVNPRKAIVPMRR